MSITLAFFTGLPFLFITFPLTDTFSIFFGRFAGFLLVLTAPISNAPPLPTSGDRLTTSSLFTGLVPKEVFCFSPFFDIVIFRSLILTLSEGQALINTSADSFFLLTISV